MISTPEEVFDYVTFKNHRMSSNIQAGKTISVSDSDLNNSVVQDVSVLKEGELRTEQTFTFKLTPGRHVVGVVGKNIKLEMIFSGDSSVKNFSVSQKTPFVSPIQVPLAYGSSKQSELQLLLTPDKSGEAFYRIEIAQLYDKIESLLVDAGMLTGFSVQLEEGQYIAMVKKAPKTQNNGYSTAINNNDTVTFSVVATHKNKRIGSTVLLRQRQTEIAQKWKSMPFSVYSDLKPSEIVMKVVVDGPDKQGAAIRGSLWEVKVLRVFSAADVKSLEIDENRALESHLLELSNEAMEKNDVERIIDINNLAEKMKFEGILRKTTAYLTKIQSSNRLKLELESAIRSRNLASIRAILRDSIVDRSAFNSELGILAAEARLLENELRAEKKIVKILQSVVSNFIVSNISGIIVTDDGIQIDLPPSTLHLLKTEIEKAEDILYELPDTSPIVQYDLVLARLLYNIIYGIERRCISRVKAALDKCQILKEASTQSYALIVDEYAHSELLTKMELLSIQAYEIMQRQDDNVKTIERVLSLGDKSSLNFLLESFTKRDLPPGEMDRVLQAALLINKDKPYSHLLRPELLSADYFESEPKQQEDGRQDNRNSTSVVDIGAKSIIRRLTVKPTLRPREPLPPPLPPPIPPVYIPSLASAPISSPRGSETQPLRNRRGPSPSFLIPVTEPTVTQNVSKGSIPISRHSAVSNSGTNTTASSSTSGNNSNSPTTTAVKQSLAEMAIERRNAADDVSLNTSTKTASNESEERTDSVVEAESLTIRSYSIAVNPRLATLTNPVDISTPGEDVFSVLQSTIMAIVGFFRKKMASTDSWDSVGDENFPGNELLSQIIRLQLCSAVCAMFRDQLKSEFHPIDVVAAAARAIPNPEDADTHRELNNTLTAAKECVFNADWQKSKAGIIRTKHAEFVAFICLAISCSEPKGKLGVLVQHICRCNSTPEFYTSTNAVILDTATLDLYCRSMNMLSRFNFKLLTSPASRNDVIVVESVL